MKSIAPFPGESVLHSAKGRACVFITIILKRKNARTYIESLHLSPFAAMHGRVHFLLMICGAWSPLATSSGAHSLSPLLHKYIAAYYLHVPLGNYIFRSD
jgi:hypothetical protein